GGQGMDIVPPDQTPRRASVGDHMLKALGSIAAGLLVYLSAAAHADDTDFPRPKSLEPAVAFWTRVYTEITTEQGFVHDDWHLNVVYQTIDVPRGLSSRERRRRIDSGIQKYRQILTKLASG